MQEKGILSWCGLVAGLGVTSASLSSGFIWACGSPCVADPGIWTASRQVPLVVIAAFTAWWGYLLAHFAWTGNLIDESEHDTGDKLADNGQLDHDLLRRAGVAFGAGVLVLGMVLGVVFIRQGHHLKTNVGGILFLGGFVIAHFLETGKPL